MVLLLLLPMGIHRVTIVVDTGITISICTAGQSVGSSQSTVGGQVA